MDNRVIHEVSKNKNKVTTIFTDILWEQKKIVEKIILLFIMNFFFN